MTSMRQLMYVKPMVLEWWEVPAPVLETGKDAIVKPLAVARCDLDAAIVLGTFPIAGPFAFGHEMTAEVVEVGDRVRGFEPGDRVIVPFQISCGECTNCRRGWTNACENEVPYAAYGMGTHPEKDYGGGLADLLRVPYADAMLLTLPQNVSPEAGAGLSDNVADGYRTVSDELARFPGEPVLIVGGLAQSVGLYAVHAALALGSSRVVYTDFDSTRLAMARAAGAETLEIADYDTAGRHDDNFLITADASGLAAGLRYAFRSTSPCGFINGVIGGLESAVELDLLAAYRRGITYTLGRVHGRRVMEHTLCHTCKGELDPMALVDRVLPFEDSIDAMLDPAIKIIFSRAAIP
ncbi:MAG: alcohol dehydrogenase catalytic domain-containing protein [Pseudomonadota bacterium]